MKTCTLLFLRRNNELLLAMKKRGFGAGRWNGVGGKVEPTETLKQALARESQEEIGVRPVTVNKVAIHNFVMPEGDEPWHMKVHVYIATKWEGLPIETEEMRPQWYKIHDIPYDLMWPDDIVWLPLVLKGQKLRTKFIFDTHDNMKSVEMHLVDRLALR